MGDSEVNGIEERGLNKFENLNVIIDHIKPSLRNEPDEIIIQMANSLKKSIVTNSSNINQSDLAAKKVQFKARK